MSSWWNTGFGHPSGWGKIENSSRESAVIKAILLPGTRTRRVAGRVLGNNMVKYSQNHWISTPSNDFFLNFGFRWNLLLNFNFYFWPRVKKKFMVAGRVSGNDMLKYGQNHWIFTPSNDLNSFYYKKTQTWDPTWKYTLHKQSKFFFFVSIF